MFDNGTIVSGISGDSDDNTNWDFEDEISRYDARLGKLVGRGVAAEYRCRTCFRRASEHSENNVKGCRLKPIKGDDYIERPNTDESLITFAPGQTVAKCSVTLVNDVMFENREDFRLVLGTPTSPIGAHIGEQACDF